jgi:hypothetical protein
MKKKFTNTIDSEQQEEEIDEVLDLQNNNELPSALKQGDPL